jgi:hypothetical protein
VVGTDPLECPQIMSTDVDDLTGTIQTTSRLPLHWWGMHSTVSGRHQFNEPPGPHRGMRKPSTCEHLRSLHLCGDADSARLASLPIDVGEIVTWFASN